jgi:DNA invertase Pin-like site-specific DNA recombinase
MHNSHAPRFSRRRVFPPAKFDRISLVYRITADQCCWLRALRIDLFLHQQSLGTTTPAGKTMFQMMGVFAEFEPAMIQERVRAGQAR